MSYTLPSGAIEEGRLADEKEKQRMPSRSTGSFLEWLVNRRTDIQKTIFEIYECLGVTGDVIVRDDVLRDLIGSSFSLWRAVFLAEFGLQRSSDLDSSRVFLVRVIRDNTITFRDDQNDWSVGYYLNNAIFRNRSALNLIGRDHSEVTAQVSENIDQMTKVMAGHAVRSSRTVWEAVHWELTTLLGLYRNITQV
jgi:hypothetical protein